MLDIVTNHMGYNGCGDCVDYSKFNPFDSVRLKLLPPEIPVVFC